MRTANTGLDLLYMYPIAGLPYLDLVPNDISIPLEVLQNEVRLARREPEYSDPMVSCLVQGSPFSERANGYLGGDGGNMSEHQAKRNTARKRAAWGDKEIRSISLAQLLNCGDLGRWDAAQHT